SKPDRLPVASRVARRDVAVAESPDRLAATELVVVLHGDEFVATLAQPLHGGGREGVLDADLQPVDPPEPWPVAGCLRVLPVVGNPDHHLDVTLRLHHSADHLEHAYAR